MSRLRKKNAGAIVFGIVVVAVLLSLILSAITLAGAVKNDWFAKDPSEQGTNLPGANGNTLQVGNIQENARMSLRVMSASSETNSVTFQATVKDVNGNSPEKIQKVTWTMAMEGDKAESYVEMTVDGTSATFTQKGPFVKQIIVTCTSVYDPSVKATVTLDCYKTVEGITASVNGVSADICHNEVVEATLADYESFNPTDASSAWNLEFLTYYTGIRQVNGTVDKKVEFVRGFMGFSYDFKEKLKEKGYTDLAAKCANTVPLDLEKTSYSQYELLNAIIGGAKDEELYAIMKVMAETSNQIIVSMDFNIEAKTDLDYSNIYYSLNCSTNAPTEIGSIEIDKSGYIF